jgi:hypothetical protein
LSSEALVSCGESAFLVRIHTEDVLAFDDEEPALETVAEQASLAALVDGHFLLEHPCSSPDARTRFGLASAPAGGRLWVWITTKRMADT